MQKPQKRSVFKAFCGGGSGVFALNKIRNLLRYGIKAKPCMESSQSDVWNQSADKFTLKRDDIQLRRS